MFDKGSALIVLGIAAIIILPLVLLSLFKKAKSRAILKELDKLASNDKAVISRNELWGNFYAMGIDNESKKLFYILKRKDHAEKSVIDLTEVDKCRIININKSIKKQDGKHYTSDRLELVFTFRNAGMAEKILEFYDNSAFMPGADELSRIENWLKVVSSNLAGNKK